MKPLTRKRRRKVHRQRMRNDAYAYYAYAQSMAKHCRCDLEVCASVLTGGIFDSAPAGGICDDVQPDVHNHDGSYDYAFEMGGGFWAEEHP